MMSEDWTVFSEESGNLKPVGYRYPRHMQLPPGQRCVRDRAAMMASPDVTERLRRRSLHAQIDRYLGKATSTPVMA